MRKVHYNHKISWSSVVSRTRLRVLDWPSAPTAASAPTAPTECKNSVRKLTSQISTVVCPGRQEYTSTYGQASLILLRDKFANNLGVIDEPTSKQSLKRKPNKTKVHYEGRQVMPSALRHFSKECRPKAFVKMSAGLFFPSM
jgi:hypothetical protein